MSFLLVGAALLAGMAVLVVTVGAAAVKLRVDAINGASARLAGELGLERVVRGQGKRIGDWYEGEHQRHRFVLSHVTLRDRDTSGDGTYRNRYANAPALRLALAVDAPPLGAIAYRRHDVAKGHRMASFEEAFRDKQQALDRIPVPTRQAMLAFVAEQGGGLRIDDWGALPLGALPDATLLEGSTVVLMHDQFGTNHTAEQVRAKLGGLVGIARTLEGR